MDRFWQLLRRTNIQLVTILVILALVGLIIWRLWVGHSTSWQTVEPPSLEDTGEATNGVGESFFSWSKALKTPGRIDRNPFSSPALDEFVAQEEQERLAAEKAAAEKAAAERAAAREAAAAQAAAELETRRQAKVETARKRTAGTKAAARPPPAPRTRDVVLVYRGMMVRPDRTTLALIENRTDGHTAFYGMGDKLTGLGITEIGRNTLALGSGADKSETMTVNEPRTFKETLTDAR